MPKLLGLDLGGLEAVAAEAGLRKFAAKQMAAWLYKRGVTDIDAMTDLPKSARAWLRDNGYEVGREAPIAEARSKDGTAKYLFKGVGGRDVEAVYIPDRDRATLCISSQAGCKMNCRFCMTGQGGWQGDLDAGAIINQVLSIPESESLTNIVFMGMGEPADNIDAVLRTVDILTSQWGMAWSPRRIVPCRQNKSVAVVPVRIFITEIKKIGKQLVSDSRRAQTYAGVSRFSFFNRLSR